MFRLCRGDHEELILETQEWGRCEEVALMSGTRTVDELGTDAQLRTQLRQVEERLVGEFGSLDADTVRRHVHDEQALFADARVQVFVPILVERAVRAKLTRV